MHDEDRDGIGGWAGDERLSSDAAEVSESFSAETSDADSIADEPAPGPSVWYRPQERTKWKRGDVEHFCGFAPEHLPGLEAVKKDPKGRHTVDPDERRAAVLEYLRNLDEPVRFWSGTAEWAGGYAFDANEYFESVRQPAPEGSESESPEATTGEEG